MSTFVESGPLRLHDAPASRLIAGWRNVLLTVVDICHGLDEAEWHRPTDLPGWSVADVAAHLAGVERGMAGLTDPPHTPDYARLPHVVNDLGRYTEIAVDLRRARSRDEVLRELAEAADVRAGQYLAGPQDLTDVIPGPFGPAALQRVLRLRALDCWAHLQDIRRAIDAPGDLGSDAAWMTATQLVSALPVVVGKRAAAGIGESVVFVIDGEVAFTRCLAVGPDSRAAFVDRIEDPTCTVTAEWEDFAVVALGRRDAAWAARRLPVVGDASLATRVLAHLNVSP